MPNGPERNADEAGGEVGEIMTLFEKCSEIPKNSDSISRQAVVDEIREWKSRLPIEGLVDHILALPPIKPEPMHGKWIQMHSMHCRTWECSKCGYRVDLEDGGIYNFCPNCGSKMGDMKDDMDKGSTSKDAEGPVRGI